MKKRTINGEISNKVSALYYGKLPEAKRDLWTKKGYRVINDVAASRHESELQNCYEEQLPSYKDVLHKVLWYTLFCKPSVLIMFTNNLNEEQLGVVKFCLTHGISVALDNPEIGFKGMLKPVHDLFSQDVEVNWELVNETLRPITEATDLHNLEALPERIVIADRYRTKEILETYGANIQLKDLDKPEIFNKILHEVTLWSYAFEMNIKTTSHNSEVMTFKPRHWYKNHDKNPNPKVSEVKISQRIKQGMKPADLNELITAYIQIQYYKKHINDFISDDYEVCPLCKRPVLRTAKHCDYCDIVRIDDRQSIEFTSYDYMSYKLEQNKQ